MINKRGRQRTYFFGGGGNKGKKKGGHKDGNVRWCSLKEMSLVLQHNWLAGAWGQNGDRNWPWWKRNFHSDRDVGFPSCSSHLSLRKVFPQGPENTHAHVNLLHEQPVETDIAAQDSSPLTHLVSLVATKTTGFGAFAWLILWRFMTDWAVVLMPLIKGLPLVENECPPPCRKHSEHGQRLRQAVLCVGQTA